MSDLIKMFLNGHRSKKSTNTSGGINIELKGNRKLLPTNDIADVISQNDQYNKERGNCNIVRLTCQVNPVCSNVLFNSVTEIVKDEGSDHVTFVNYKEGGNDPFSGVIYKDKNMNFWGGNEFTYETTLNGANSTQSIQTYTGTTIPSKTATSTAASNHPTNAIRDLQLTNLGFDYHCGLDIFNNHLLRSNTFKCVCKLNNNYDGFNTIADVMRDTNGNRVIEKVPYPIEARVANNAKIVSLHLYKYDDIDSFKSCVKKKLINTFDGWVGFENASKIKTYDDFNKNEELMVERPIISKNGGDFIDMYPGRDLYSFVPKYNKFRNRVEKNWNYCVTYPSSSYTPSNDNEPFGEVIDYKLKSMRIALFDENTRADNGTLQIVFYCVSKHGLSVGDRVNVYKSWGENDEKIIDSAVVDNVVDDYIFVIYNPNVQISDQWLDISSIEEGDGFEIDGKYVKRNGKYYRIINDSYANVDDNAQRLSFKKVVNDIECDYYVRIFSRLPNFKFASGDTSNEYEVYRKRENGKSMLEVYQDRIYEFESHVSRLAFANNSYSDLIGEIVFTDDINIANIKDNLGRPITSLYLTITKNNKGYKEWYGHQCGGRGLKNINSENVEYSHCFGKVKCGIEMCEEYDNIVAGAIDSLTIDIRKITSDSSKGLPISFINKEHSYTNGQNMCIANDEVWVDNDINYYGDISYYDNYNAVERHIQPVLNRVNTAQRELGINGVSFLMADTFKDFVYDEIDHDDYDTDKEFSIKSTVKDRANQKKEGYFYNPHYEIPINTFGRLNSVMPDFLTLRKIIKTGTGTLEITTMQSHYLSKGDKMIIYDWKEMKYYYCLTTVNISNKMFRCKVYDEDDNLVDDMPLDDLLRYRAFKMDNIDAPDYANILKDGTCRVIWRNVVKNGMDESDKSVETYPFTNGAFYVNKRIDLYLRRQDPYNEYGLYDDEDLPGNVPDYEVKDNYVKEDEITC